MSEDETDWEEVPDLLDRMAPGVRLCLERGNAIRIVKAEILADLNQFVGDLIELYPGHEDSIRKGLEGAAAQLLSARDRRKRDEQTKADDSNKPVTDQGANGVSGGVHGGVRGDTEGGEGDAKSEGNGG